MCTHLHERGGRYSIRRRIPTDLIEHYGRREIVRALGTSDRKEAVRRCRIEGVKLDEEFERARAALADPPHASPEVQQRRATHSLAGGVEVERDGWGRVSMAVDWESVDVESMASRRLAVLRHRRNEAADSGPGALDEFMARAWRNLENQEAFLSGDMPPMQPLAVHEAWRDALRTFLTGDGKVCVQEVVETTIHPTTGPTSNQAHGTSLSDLTNKWAGERKPEKRTVGKMNLVIARFEEYVGSLSVERITRQHVVAFKDKLLTSGQTSINTDKQLTNFRTLLNYARDNALIDLNPADGIRVGERKNAKAARLPFDLAALQAIFTSPVYAQGERPEGGAGEAGYWLPLLALFHGARLEELAQLRPDDVYAETYRTDDGESSCWVMRVTNEGEGQRVKNAGSVRRFPIHHEVLARGFVEYAQSRRGKPRIFDKLKPDTDGRLGGLFGKWFSKYLRGKCKVTDARMVFHSFRHLFKDMCRDAGISDEVHDALSGHSSGKVSSQYGGLTYPLRPLVAAVQGYRIPGLTLPNPPTKI